MHPSIVKILTALLLTAPAIVAGAQDREARRPVPAADSIFIDKIVISKNWITWDRIIRNELVFTEGEYVRPGEIDTSMNKVWNIGNFADVDYELVEGPNGDTLKIRALDAVKFYPLLTIDHSSENDYNYRLGAGDDNFLGSNAKLKIAWQKNPNGVKWDFSLGLPRQLLYKNMTTRFGYTRGNETRLFLDRVISGDNGDRSAEYVKRMLAPYDKVEFYLEIGNPWHLDYQYRFSPDLSLRYMKHVINHELLPPEDLELGVEVPEQEYRFLSMAVSESVGTVNIKRHRKDGYRAGGSYTLDLGLHGTDSYHTFGLEAEYHQTLNRIIQLSAEARTGYTTATDQYKFIKGSSDVLGLRTGEIYGQSYYSSYAGAHFTWLNTKWISLENAYFVNVGNGADVYGDLFRKSAKLATGTSLEIRFPIAPIAVFRFTFMYAGPGSEWFKFNLE